MDILRNIRLKRGKAILSKRMVSVKRSKFRGNIEDVKQIGIVWDASVVSDFEYLSIFYQTMQERGINVKIIGYYPDKILPDRLTAIRFLTCLKKQDINFFFIPVSDEAEKFIKTPFDILIDVNFNNVFPLQYITAMSSASLKIGLYEGGTNAMVFDMMLDISKKSKINDYLDHIVHYLEMINTKSEIKNQQI